MLQVVEHDTLSFVLYALGTSTKLFKTLAIYCFVCYTPVFDS